MRTFPTALVHFPEAWLWMHKATENFLILSTVYSQIPSSPSDGHAISLEERLAPLVKWCFPLNILHQSLRMGCSGACREQTVKAQGSGKQWGCSRGVDNRDSSQSSEDGLRKVCSEMSPPFCQLTATLVPGGGTTWFGVSPVPKRTARFSPQGRSLQCPEVGLQDTLECVWPRKEGEWGQQAPLLWEYRRSLTYKAVMPNSPSLSWK